MLLMLSLCPAEKPSTFLSSAAAAADNEVIVLLEKQQTQPGETPGLNPLRVGVCARERERRCKPEPRIPFSFSQA